MDKVRKNKRLLAICLILLIIITFTYSILDSVYAESYSNDFDNTNVMDDLFSSKQFDINQYPYRKGEKPRVIHLAEYCYSYNKNMQGNYAIYVYVYNPANDDISLHNGRNSIQLACEWDDKNMPLDYSKFALAFCNKADGDYDNRFLKYRVIDKENILLNNVNPDERRYDISGIELITNDGTKIEEYEVGATYKYSGYASGYGSNIDNESTLKCNVVKLDFLKLNLKKSFYRPDGENINGYGHRDQINSVYFFVPDEIFQEHGKLQEIKVNYYEYKSSLSVVTKNKDFYSYMIDNRAVIHNNLGANMPYGLATNVKLYPEIGYTADYGFNMYRESNKQYLYKPKNVVRQLPYIFYLDDLVDKKIKPDEYLKYIYEYNSSYHNGTLDKFNYSKDLFMGTVGNGRKEGFNEFIINSDSEYNLLTLPVSTAWDRFWGVNNKPADNLNVSPINEILKLTDIDKMYVDDIFKDTLKEDFNKGKSANERMILLHFAVTDYYSDMARIVYDNGKDRFNAIDNEAYLFQQTVFLDFDIIWLKFFKNDTYKVIPTVSTPIDITGSGEPPLDINQDNDWWKWVLLVLGLVLLVIVLFILSPILFPIISLIVKGIAFVILLPFRLIGKLFGKGKKKQKNKNKRE